MLERMRVLALLIVAMAGLSACGGGGGSSAAPPPPPPPPPIPTNAGGIWEGSTFNNQNGATVPAVGVMTEGNTEGRFISDEGMQFTLSGVSGTDGNLNATITAYAPFPLVFLDGSSVTSGTLTATVIERTSLEGSWTLNTGESGTVTMQYDPIYERDSDLALGAGVWGDSFGAVWQIDADGTMFFQDAFGCTLNGAISIIDASFNVYRWVFTLTNCPGLDGSDYAGLGSLVDLNGTNDLWVYQVDNQDWILADAIERL